MLKFIKVFNEYINVNSIDNIFFDSDHDGEKCKIYYANGKVKTIIIPGNNDAKEIIEGIKRFLGRNLI